MDRTELERMNEDLNAQITERIISSCDSEPEVIEAYYGLPESEKLIILNFTAFMSDQNDYDTDFEKVAIDCLIDMFRIRQEEVQLK